jgi:hypothetical protein
MQDVNLAESTVSGYLSIQHLTDAHPSLTTFFTGEIIGPEHGFITGTRFGASENDDMRHWGRFEQFRRPATRGDMVRPELFLRDPQPDRNQGETRAKDRDFMFLRIKERFLVPDHRVKDISGASFAGELKDMLGRSGLTSRLLLCDDWLLARIASGAGIRHSTGITYVPSTRPIISADNGTSQNINRWRISGAIIPSTIDARDQIRTSQIPWTAWCSTPNEWSNFERGQSIVVLDYQRLIDQYYFHSLNQEPFQELFLTHVPTRSLSTFEMR